MLLTRSGKAAVRRMHRAQCVVARSFLASHHVALVASFAFGVWLPPLPGSLYQRGQTLLLRALDRTLIQPQGQFGEARSADS